jgi:hypothetical protein
MGLSFLLGITKKTASDTLPSVVSLRQVGRRSEGGSVAKFADTGLLFTNTTPVVLARTAQCF